MWRYCYEKTGSYTKYCGIFFAKYKHISYLYTRKYVQVQIFMAGNGSVINIIRLACLGKRNGQPHTLSPEGLFFHAPYSVSNQSNKSVENLDKCEICVNTHTHTHILTGIPRALIYLFSKRYARTKTLFFGSFPPFSVFVCPLLSTFKLNDYEYRNNTYHYSCLSADCCGHLILAVLSEGGFMVEPLCMYHCFRHSAVSVYGVALSVPFSSGNHKVTSTSAGAICGIGDGTILRMKLYN